MNKSEKEQAFDDLMIELENHATYLWSTSQTDTIVDRIVKKYKNRIKQ